MYLTEEEEAIDLRAVVHSLFKNKWLIIGLVLVSAIIALLVSKLIVTKQFEATALVMITKPTLNANFDARLQSTPQLLDTHSLTNLALSDELLKSMADLPEIAPILDESQPIESIKGHLRIELVGTDQLRLTVTDSDPQMASLIANIWAKNVVSKLNDLLGTSKASLDQMDGQIKTAYNNWSQAEQTLLEKLKQNQAVSLEVQRDQASDSLKVYLDKLRQNNLIISDARSLDARLAKQDNVKPLRLEDALSLIALNQQAGGGLTGLQLQISSPEILGGQFTVSEARTNLSNLIITLENQSRELQTAQADLEKSVTSLTAELEAAQYEQKDLTVKRDLAQAAYQALSSQAEEKRISLAQNDQTARLAGLALPPENPSKPNTYQITILAGGVGLIIGILIALVREWWLATDNSMDKNG